MRIDPTTLFVSPGTIFFILLSSVVQIVALRQWATPSNSISISAPVIPENIRHSSSLHTQYLNCLKEHNRRFNHVVIEKVHNLLSQNGACKARNDTSPECNPLDVLMRYRWCEGGSGIDEMPESQARTLWNQGQRGRSYHQPPSGEDMHGAADVRTRILRLCGGYARLCQQGYFDLNISYLYRFRNNNGWGLGLTGEENRDFRCCMLKLTPFCRVLFSSHNCG